MQYSDKDYEIIGKQFVDFCKTIAALRHPQTGCPWDVEQTHSTLKRYMIEEAYEAAAEMQDDAREALCEELGDVLLQVVLNSQIASDEDRFTILEVVKSINKKMIRRHPHVFGDDSQKQSRDIASIKTNWQKIKASEKSFEEPTCSKGYFESEKVRKVFPATLQAHKIGRLSKKIDFDWEGPEDCLAHFLSEVDELKSELKASNFAANEKVKSELSDVYFTLAQVCRKLKVCPEEVADSGNLKFLERFKAVEALLLEKGKNAKTASKEELEAAWNKAKSE